MSAIPGPLSRAITTMPCLSVERTSRTMISPCLAYMTILRASSEMAVAIKVRSVEENPSLAASVRPVCRALTISRSDAIGMRVSAASHLDLSPGLRLGLTAALIGLRSLLTQLLSLHTPCAKRTGFSSGSFNLTIQKCKTFFQVQCRGYTGQVEPQLDQGECDFRLDSDDDGFGPPQADHLRDVTQRTRGK